MTDHQHGRFAMYSATRQWNPGDEFILAGTRRIIDTALGPFDPVLYDRNPDVRPGNGATSAYRNVKRPLGEDAGALYEKLSAYLRLGFFSNSVKFDSDMSFASLAVLGGSPEWATARCWSFYDHVYRNRLPLVGLGLGSMPPELPEFVHAGLRDAVLLTTRSRSLAESSLAKQYGIDYLPCPALLSAPAAHQVTDVRRVGVVIGVPYEHSVWANGLDDDFYAAVCESLENVIARFGDQITFDFILHYIDEVPVVRERFPDHNIRYSFDSNDYFDIFADYDMVISTRVHGCGIAASLGIPSISMGHDFRSDTTDGFLAVTVDPAPDRFALSSAFEQLAARISDASAELQTHRESTLGSYVELLQNRFEGGVHPVDYDEFAVVTFEEDVSPEIPDALHLETLVHDLADDARELRTVLRTVEASKAEMGIELDGARAAVIRLEETLAQQSRDAEARNTPLQRLARKFRR